MNMRQAVFWRKVKHDGNLEKTNAVLNVQAHLQVDDSMSAHERGVVLGNEAANKWARQEAELHLKVLQEPTNVLKDVKIKMGFLEALREMLAAGGPPRKAFGIGSIPE